MATKREIRHVLTLDGEQKYSQALANVGKALGTVKSQQALLDAQFGKGNTSMEKLTQQHALLQQKLDLQKQKLEAVRAAYEKAKKATGENSDVTRDLAKELNYALTAVANTENEIKTLSSTMDKANSRTEKFKQALKDAGISLDSVGKATEKTGQALTKFATSAVIAGIGTATKLYMDFGDSLAMLETMPQAAAYGMSKLSDEILAASNATGVAATEIASATYDAISSGAAAADAVGMVAGAAKTAKAGASDVTTVIKGAAAAMNAWGIATEKSNEVYDKFLVAQDAGVLTAGDIAANIGQVTGLAGPLNVSLEETLAAVSALTLNGVAVGSAFTSLRAIMSNVLKPTTEAAEEAKRLGIEFDTTALKTKGLTGFLADVQAKTGGSEESLAKLFGSVEGLSSVMALGTTAAASYADILGQLGSSAGTLDTKFATRMASDTQKLAVEFNKLKNTAIQFGATLAPYIGMLTDGLGQLTTFMQGLSEEQRKQIINNALLVAGIGPILIGVGKLIQSFSAIKKGFNVLSTLVGGGGTLTLIAGAIAAVTVGIMAIKNHMDSMSGLNKLKAAFDGIEIDQSAIDNAISAAESVEREMNLTLEAKVQLSQNTLDLNQNVVKWLTDGKRETSAQRDLYVQMATEAFEPATSAIEEAFTTKKAALDKALASGIISPEQYQKQLDELTAQTDNMKGALSTETNAYIAYMLELSRSGEGATVEQQARLEELRQKILQVSADILNATSTATQAAKASYSLVSAGGGDTEDYAVGAKYVMSVKAISIESAKSLYKSNMAALQTKLDEASASGDDEATLKIQAGMQLERDTLDTSIADAEQQYSDAIGAMIEGLAKKYPGQAKMLGEAVEKQALVEEILGALNSYNAAATPEEQAQASEVLNDIWSSLFEGVPLESSVPLELSEYVDGPGGLKAQISKVLENANFDDVFTKFKTLIDEGATAGLTAGGTSGFLSDMLTATDLQDDQQTVREVGLRAGAAYAEGAAQGAESAKEVFGPTFISTVEQAGNSVETAMYKAGEDSLSGFEEGAKDKEADIKKTFEKIAGVALSGTRVFLSIESPSKKFIKVGEDSIEGMIVGAERKRAALIAKYRSIANAALQASRQALAIHSPSKKFEEIGEYTAAGMINGLNNRIAAVQTTMRKMVSPNQISAQQQDTAAAQAVKAVAPVNVSIQYTGSVSQRDARKLANTVAASQRRIADGQGA